MNFLTNKWINSINWIFKNNLKAKRNSIWKENTEQMFFPQRKVFYSITIVGPITFAEKTMLVKYKE